MDGEIDGYTRWMDGWIDRRIDRCNERVTIISDYYNLNPLLNWTLCRPCWEKDILWALCIDTWSQAHTDVELLSCDLPLQSDSLLHLCSSPCYIITLLEYPRPHTLPLLCECAFDCKNAACITRTNHHYAASLAARFYCIKCAAQYIEMLHAKSIFSICEGVEVKLFKKKRSLGLLWAPGPAKAVFRMPLIDLKHNFNKKFEFDQHLERVNFYIFF